MAEAETQDEMKLGAKMKLVIDESVPPCVKDGELFVHRGASVSGQRFCGVEIRHIHTPFSDYDVDWFSKSVLTRLLPTDA